LQHAAIGFDDFCIVTAPLANAGIAGIALGSLESRRDRAGIAQGSPLLAILFVFFNADLVNSTVNSTGAPRHSSMTTSAGEWAGRPKRTWPNYSPKISPILRPGRAERDPPSPRKRPSSSTSPPGRKKAPHARPDDRERNSCVALTSSEAAGRVL
jgi:hypothetical protein